MLSSMSIFSTFSIENVRLVVNSTFKFSLKLLSSPIAHYRCMKFLIGKRVHSFQACL